MMESHPAKKGKRQRGLLATGAAVLLAVWLSGCGQEAAKAPAPRESAAPFKVTTFDNGAFSLEAAKGRPVVINFWASWCGPCKLEARTLERAYQTFKPYGVEFIGIAVDDTEEGAKAFIKKYGLTFPMALDSGEIMKAYSIYGVPKTYILGHDGQVAYTHTGAISEDDLAREIRKAM